MVAAMSAKYPDQTFGFIKCDMCVMDSVRAAFKQAVDHYKQIDILMWAGLMEFGENSGSSPVSISATTRDGRLIRLLSKRKLAMRRIVSCGAFKRASISDPRFVSDWMTALEGHLVGTVLLTRLAMSHWHKNGIEGVCVSTASIVGMLPDNESGPTYHPDISYSLSKVGMVVSF